MLRTPDIQPAIETIRIFSIRVEMICLYPLLEEFTFGHSVSSSVGNDEEGT